MQEHVEVSALKAQAPNLECETDIQVPGHDHHPAICKGFRYGCGIVGRLLVIPARSEIANRQGTHYDVLHLFLYRATEEGAAHRETPEQRVRKHQYVCSEAIYC